MKIAVVITIGAVLKYGV